MAQYLERAIIRSGRHKRAVEAGHMPPCQPGWCPPQASRDFGIALRRENLDHQQADPCFRTATDSDAAGPRCGSRRRRGVQSGAAIAPGLSVW
jgi:hypothetical protein